MLEQMGMRLLRAALCGLIAGAIGLGISLMLAPHAISLLTSIVAAIGFAFGLIFKLRVK